MSDDLVLTLRTLLAELEVLGAPEFQRRRLIEVLGLRVFVASIEDVIVSKLEWSKLAGGSSRQLDDVVALIELAGPHLDEQYVEESAAELGVTDGLRSARAAAVR